jgi:hypothetical protein
LIGSAGAGKNDGAAGSARAMSGRSSKAIGNRERPEPATIARGGSAGGAAGGLNPPARPA